MSHDILCCDYCGEDHYQTTIIEKPLRFGHKGEIYSLWQMKNDGRLQDNICLQCLNQDIKTTLKSY